MSYFLMLFKFDENRLEFSKSQLMYYLIMRYQLRINQQDL